MGDNSPVNEKFQALREQAEKLLADGEGRGLNIDQHDLVRLAHELEVHQMELELQNQELRRAQRDLEASRDEFAGLYESAPVGYVTLDRNGLIEKANSAAYAILGFEHAIVGRPLYKFIAKDDFTAYYDYLKRIASGEKPGPVELRILGPEGVICVQAEATTQTDGDGNLRHWRLSLVDISERKKSEEALFQSAFENAAVGIAHVSSDGHFKRVNQGLCQITGYSKDELQGKTFQEMTHPDDLAEDLELSEQLIKGEIDNYRLEKRYIKKDGNIVWVRLTVSKQSEGLGIEIVEDITDRRQAESDRDRSERLYRSIAANLPGGAVFVVDKDLRYMLSNGEALRAVGMTAEQLEGKTIHEALDPALATLYEPYYRSALAGVPFVYEHFSHGRVFLSRGVPLRDTDGKIYAALAFSQDITERKQAEEALQKAHDRLEERIRERTAELETESNQRRYLANRLVELFEEERRSLSAMLHDDLGQLLAGAKIELENLQGALRKGEALPASALDQSVVSIQGIIASLRETSRRLRPTALDVLGLIAALRSLGDGRQTDRCPIDFTFRNVPENLDPDLEIAIFRIAQEAVINAIKHAGCNKVYLSLMGKGNSLSLSVEDDGCGFQLGQVFSGSSNRNLPLGLVIMRERAVNAGGEIRFESSPGKGTIVMAEFPIRKRRGDE